MKDPLPALVAAKDLVDVTHANDKLALSALDKAITGLVSGASLFDVRVGLTSTRGTLHDLGRMDAVQVLDLALAELN
jgi:hypothetical protein